MKSLLKSLFNYYKYYITYILGTIGLSRLAPLSTKMKSMNFSLKRKGFRLFSMRNSVFEGSHSYDFANLTSKL